MAEEATDTETSEMTEDRDTEMLEEQKEEDYLTGEEVKEGKSEPETEGDIPHSWETYAVESVSSRTNLEGEMSDVIFPEEPLVHYGEEEEVIGGEIVSEGVTEETELISSSSDDICGHAKIVFSTSDIDLDKEKEINLLIGEKKPKGRVFRKFSQTLDDSDAESVPSESLIILPRVIKDPLLLRQIFPIMKAVKYDEYTDRLEPGDPFEVESVYDEKHFFEPEEQLEEIEKKENAILRISFIKKVMAVWIPKRDTMEVFEKFFDLESESEISADQVKPYRTPKLSPVSLVESPSEHFDRLSQYFLVSMCRKYKDRYWDLVLHGKEVEMQIGRRIVDDDIVFIFEFCSYNDVIRYVDLCYNHITGIGLALIAEYVTLNHNIIGLNVMNNEIKSISKLTRKQLGLMSNLRQVRLNGNPLNKQGRINAACLLKYNQLELLDLAETSQNLRSVAWIAEFAQNCTSIKVLDVSRILGQRGYNLRTYQVAFFFSDVLQHNKSLSELHLQKNRLNDNDIEQLMVGLVVHQNLKVIDLTCNDICDFGAEIIAKSLDKVKSLISLSLACNKIRNAGTRALSLRLPYSKIAILNLARNQIGDEGMIDLMYSIRKPYPLQALFIFGNPFGETTLETLSDCLKTCTLSPNTVDTHVTIVDGVFSVVHYPLGDRYKPRYYRQYESWRPGVWRWNGAPPMYYGIKRFEPSNRFKSRNKFPMPTWESDINSCGI